MEHDLVCGMEVEGQDNSYFSDYGGEMYYFCSADCKRQFDDHPDDYIRKDARERLGL